MDLFATQIYTVTEINRAVRLLLESEARLQDAWVAGEISNLSRPVSGHVYFTLKDAAASLRCVIWKSNAWRVRFNLQNGLAVEAHGAVSVYERDGMYQLYVDTLRPAGEGRLFQEFLRLKAQLEADGLFDEQRKRHPPAFPRRIGVVTSATGAALQDILNTLGGRFPLAEVILAPTAVQGSEAPPQIVAALAALNRVKAADVIILARGGGSLEDLWCFNDERVVRAVVASQIPVITGIGHETDFTLADFAADVRAPTPTAAAVAATPHRDAVRQGLLELRARLENAWNLQHQTRQVQLSGLNSRLERSSPAWRIRNDMQRVDQLAQRCQSAVEHFFQVRKLHLEGVQHRLTALNPLAVLQRGYAVVRLPEGGVVRSARSLQPGQAVDVRLAEGGFTARVEQVKMSQQDTNHADE